MYGTAATMSGHSSEAPAVQDSLYTQERHLYYLAMETFIYQYRKSIGMLSAYAEPFYSPTEETKQTEEIKKEESERNNEIEKNPDIKKDETSQNNNNLSTKENIPIREVNEIIEEEWVKVKRNERTKVVRVAKQEEYTKCAKNQYAAIKEDEELLDKKDDVKKLPTEVVQEKENEKKRPAMKIEAVDKRRTYNINEISVDEMVKHINEYNEKDDNAKALKDKMNVKSDNSKYRKTSSNLSFGTKEKKNDNIIVDINSGSDGETDDDKTTTDDDDFMIDDDDSVDYPTIEDLNEEDQLYVEGLKDAREITVNGYQNNLLLFRLEQAEDKEERLLKELKAIEKESTEKAEKIAALESALKKKTELLLNELRNKG